MRSGEDVGYGPLSSLGWADAVNELRQGKRELLCIDPTWMRRRGGARRRAGKKAPFLGTRHTSSKSAAEHTVSAAWSWRLRGVNQLCLFSFKPSSRTTSKVRVFRQLRGSASQNTVLTHPSELRASEMPTSLKAHLSMNDSAIYQRLLKKSRLVPRMRARNSTAPLPRTRTPRTSPEMHNPLQHIRPSRAPMSIGSGEW